MTSPTRDRRGQLGIAVYLVALGAIALSGCGSTTAPDAGTSPPAAPANPVPLLRRAGADVPAGVTAGQVDIYGDRYATGTYPGGEEITVYTFASVTAERADLVRNGTPQDGRATIVGHLYDIGAVAVQTNSGEWAWSVPPSVIAKRVHGSVRG